MKWNVLLFANEIDQHNGNRIVSQRNEYIADDVKQYDFWLPKIAMAMGHEIRIKKIAKETGERLSHRITSN